MSWPVAALYVDSTGPYGDRVEEVFDARRNAMTYRGRLPVVAHPPCGPWGRLAWSCRKQDPATGLHAVAMVRKHGGVLEHPVGSQLFAACDIPAGDWDNPERELDAYGGFTIRVKQWDYGHRGEKDTILYIVGTDSVPPLLDREGGTPRPVQNMCARERRLSPTPFADWLCSIAARCATGLEWAVMRGQEELVVQHHVTEHQRALMWKALQEKYTLTKGWLTGPWWTAQARTPPFRGESFYSHLVWGPKDDSRLSRKERQEMYPDQGNATAWRKAVKAATVEDWMIRIEKLLTETPKPRTFNQIILELTRHEYNAIVFYRSAADEALWRLVAQRRLAHTLVSPTHGHMLFAHPDTRLDEAGEWTVELLPPEKTDATRD